MRRAGVAVLLAPGALVFVLAMAGPWLAGEPARSQGIPFAPPGPGHPLGLWRNGWDVLDGVLAGGRPVVVLPLVAAATASAVGAAIGLWAAVRGSPLDGAVRWLAGLVLTLPPLLVVLVLIAGWGTSGAVLAAAVVLTGAPFVARLADAAARPVLGQGFVEYAVASGDPPRTILVREVLPMVAGPLLADAGLRVVGAVYLVATASYLGFGPAGPVDWARMIAEGADGGERNPWAVLAPAGCLATLVVTANLLVDRAARRLNTPVLR